MITAGIDAGSRAVKAVLFDAERREVVGCGIADQGVEQARLAEQVFACALEEAQIERARVAAIIATGYGRTQVGFADTTITEITCHAQGVYHWLPHVRTIVEIGGQDSKFMRLDGGGRVRDFAMNDRCAAGTGRFLEMVASRLEVDLPTLGELSQQSTKPALISNTCVVFAETEIIGLLAQGVPRSDIAAGVQLAMATRIGGMAGPGWEKPVCFTGGVALQPSMVRALAEVLSCPLTISPQPQYTGALGAAILGAKRRSAAGPP